jgi:branched-subunit amino acid aminotransferase/4-amino-4-deoxychorismate lyase
MSSWFFYNGHLTNESPKINLVESSLLLGESIFISFPMLQGRFLALNSQLDRLKKQSSLWWGDTEDVFKGLVQDFNSNASIIAKKCSFAYCRVTMFRGPSSGPEMNINYFFWFKSEKISSFKCFEHTPLEVESIAHQYQWQKSFCKLGQYSHLLGMSRAKKKDFLLFDREDNVLELTSSNLVLADDDGLYLIDQALDYYEGQTQELLKDFCRFNSVPLRYKKIALKDIKQFNLVMAVNLLKGVTAITRIDEFHYAQYNRNKWYQLIKEELYPYLLKNHLVSLS